MTSTVSETGVVQPNDFIILKKDEENMVIIQATPTEETRRFAKKTAKVKTLIGKRYGEWVEMSEGEFVSSKSPSELIAAFADTKDTQVITKDNRNLNDNNQSQQLTAEQITAMKKEGKSGEEGIKAIVSNSNTYDTKTVYSQEKYIKKKISKHVCSYQILPANPYNVCLEQNIKSASRAGRIREDTLSFILFHIDIRSSVCVLDSTNGLILGSILRATTSDVDVYNLRVGGSQVGLVKILANNRKQEHDKEHKDEVDEKEEKQVIVKIEPEIYEKMTPEEKRQARLDRKKILNQRQSKLEKSYGYKEIDYEKVEEEMPLVDSLVVVSDIDPNMSVMKLFNKLKNSGTFIIYSQYLQRLGTLYDKLWRNKCIVFSDIIEPFSRTIQVLPNRTHPSAQ